MKKLIFASVMALASISLVSSPMLRAQDSITIKDPVEFNTYDFACGGCASHSSQTLSETITKSSAPGLESFLTAYPQSVVKKSVLDLLLDVYYTPKAQGGQGDNDKALSAASRLLQSDPNNLKAILYSVFIKKGQCAKTQDAQTCDDAAALARKGLLTPKPADIADADWKKQTSGSYPVFHSAIAFDDAAAHKDFKGAVDEYTAELMLYSDQQTQSLGLMDTFLLARVYTQPGAKDLVKAIWFYARVWNFVPAPSKPDIEKQLEYWYTKYHGNLTGLDDIKAKAALTTFPPGALVIAQAETPAQKIHDLIVSTPDLRVLNLGDKETVLAVGTKEDADKLWGVLKDQATPVPGMVIEAPVTVLKVVVTEGVKATDFIVHLTTPVACKDFSAPGPDLKAEQDFILASGVKDDAAKLSTLFEDPKTPIKKIAIEPLAGTIKVAVTADAKSSKTADFIVNLKTPVSCKEAPAAGFNYGQQSKGEAELDGTYDTYTQVPATDTVAPSALIVLRDGVIVAEKKKPAGAAHPKPAAGHHKAAR